MVRMGVQIILQNKGSGHGVDAISRLFAALAARVKAGLSLFGGETFIPELKRDGDISRSIRRR